MRLASACSRSPSFGRPIMHEIVWLGRGGQGAFTAARLLGLSAVCFAGKQAMAFPSFGPERRGAPVFAYTRIDDRPVIDRSAVRHAEAAVIMDESLLTQVATGFLQPETLVIVDAEPDEKRSDSLPGKLFRIPARRIARETLGSDHTNTALLGVLIGLTGWLPPEAAIAGIEREFGGGSRAAKNVEAFRRAEEIGRQLRSGEQHG